MTAEQRYWDWYKSKKTDTDKDTIANLYMRLSKHIKENNLAKNEEEFWLSLLKLSRYWFKRDKVDVIRWHLGRGDKKREIKKKMIYIDKIFESEKDDYLAISGLAGLLGRYDNTQEKIEIDEKFHYLYDLILSDSKNPFQKRNPQIKIKIIELLRENTPRKEIAQRLNISEALINHSLRRAKKIVTAIKNLP